MYVLFILVSGFAGIVSISFHMFSSIMGGSIMAAWPLLVGMLGFTEAAMGLMFALFLIQDSFGTAANITGDASIAMIVNRMFPEGGE